MSSKTSTILFFWGPPLLYIVVVFCVSYLPLSVLKLSANFSDKLLHFLEYGVLAILLARALRRSLPNKHRLFIGLMVVLLIIAIGSLDELYQYHVPHRQADIRDLVADVIGGFLGCVMYLFLYWFFVEKRKLVNTLVSH